MKSYRLRKLKRSIGWRLKTSRLTRKLIVDYVSRKNKANEEKTKMLIEDSDKVIITNMNLRLGMVKDDDKLSFSLETYWPKYERFARNNNLQYSFYNIHKDNWITEARNFDLIIWRPFCDPALLYEDITKAAYIEKFLKIPCHPSSCELWTYEDKIRQYYHLSSSGLPMIPTFISFDEEECLEKLRTFEYPLVSKSYIGSSSFGVSLLKNETEARRHIKKAFSGGIDTGFPYFRQKGYVYLQKYLDDAEYDLRIILVGSRIFGYYRMRPKHDFRASGAGLVDHRELPVEVVLLAIKAKEVMPATVLAVDFLKSRKENKYYISETSISITVDMIRNLEVNGIIGYHTLKNGALEFHPARVWLQEFILEELIRKHFNADLESVII